MHAGGASSLWGVSVDQDGNIYWCDPQAYVVRKVTPTGQKAIVAGSEGERYFPSRHLSGSEIGDGGAATEAILSRPMSSVLDEEGNLFIADDFVIRKVTPDGIISTYAGIYTKWQRGYYEALDCFSTPGPASDKRLMMPRHLTIAPDGSLYFLNSVGIARISTDGEYSPVYRGGTWDSVLGTNGIETAELGSYDIKCFDLDSRGDIYIAAGPHGTYNMGSSALPNIYHISSNGVATRIAGNDQEHVLLTEPRHVNGVGPLTAGKAIQVGSVSVDDQDRVWIHSRSGWAALRASG